METVGKDIVILDFQKGFTAQFSTATCVCLGSSLGLPLSTTHCMVGALAGTYIASKSNIFKQIYWTKSADSEISDRQDTSKMSCEND